MACLARAATGGVDVRWPRWVRRTGTSRFLDRGGDLVVMVTRGLGWRSRRARRAGGHRSSAMHRVTDCGLPASSEEGDY